MAADDTQLVSLLRAGKPAKGMALRIGLLTTAGALVAASSIAAQSIFPDDVLTFRKRSISDLLPVGIRAGGFLISPGIEVSGVYDDNIYRTKNNEESDFITNVKPAIGIQSNWNRHALFFGAEGDFGFYRDNTENNFEDYGLIASGQYDFTEGTTLIVALSQARRHESRGLTADSNGAAPIEYTATRQQFQFTRDLSMLQLDIHGQNEDVEISDTTALGVPTSRFTDRDSQRLGSTLTYEYMPGNALFAGGTYHTTDYHLPTGVAREAHGADLRGGIEFDTARGVRGSLYSTYVYRTYDGGPDDTKRPYIGASLFWDVTPLTTLSALLDNSFADTTVSGAAGVVRTTRRLMLKQKLTTRVTADVSGGLNHYEYVGGDGALNRTTKLSYGGMGGEFKATDNFGLRAAYDMQQRTSPLASDEYRDQRVSLSVIYMY